MSIAQIPQPQFSDRRMHCTGYAPSASALGAARASLLNVANYKGHGILCIGEKSVRSGDHKYHVFFPSIEDRDGNYSIRIFIDIAFYSYSTTDQSGTVDVYDHNGDPVGISRPITIPAGGEAAETANAAPKGPAFQFVVDAPVDLSARYTWITVVCDAGTVARFTASFAPMPSGKMTTDTIYNLGGGNFQPGARLIGYNRSAGSSGSVDAIAQFQNSLSDTGQSFLSASQRCLWGWSHPGGRYHVRTSGTGWTAFMKASFTPRVQPRNLKSGDSSTQIPVDICIAYRADDGAKIRFSPSAMGALEIGLTENVTATPSVIFASALLNIPATGDDLEIEVYTTNAIAVELWAIAIFEPRKGRYL